MEKGSYKNMVAMLCISFVIMYGVMFLNVASADHIYLSETRLFMSLLMVSPMAVLMILLMGKMYPNKKLNTGIISGSVLVFVLALFLLRSQATVGDAQYMKAMIPHHSSAILTSTHADIQDPEVKELAEGIIKTQKKEIAEMKRILARMEE